MKNFKRPFRRDRNKRNKFPTPKDVTEESLQVWLSLPSKIRHDPSWASFQLEHARLHGEKVEESPRGAEDGDSTDDEENRESDFITMNVPSDINAIREVPENLEKENSTDAKIGDHSEPSTRQEVAKRYSKIAFLLLLWFISTAALTTTREKDLKGRLLSVPKNETKYYILPSLPTSNLMNLKLRGAFRRKEVDPKQLNFYLDVQVQIVTLNKQNDSMVSEEAKNILDFWRIPVVRDNLRTATYTDRSYTFQMAPLEYSWLHEDTSNKRLRLALSTNLPEMLTFTMFYDNSPVNIHVGAILAALVLIFLYVLIIWEIVHRTFAAILASLVALAILALLGDRPTMSEIFVWMDTQTLLLLFSMMILVAILTETGVFDYVAVLTFKLTNGKIWPLIHCLCLITCIVSAFLDNVTTVLLMTPVTIRLCEVLSLNPVPVLMSIVIHANIGGTLTPIGDPPNMIITAHPYIAKNGVTFFSFVAHMCVGVILVIFQTFIQLRISFRDIHALRLIEPKEMKEIRKTILVWQRAADSLSSYSKNVDVVKASLKKKVKVLQHKLRKLELAGTVSTEAYQHTLEELKAAYPIKNKPLLIKSGLVLLFVLTVFFVQSIPGLQRLNLGWAALLGVVLLLIITNRDDIDALMSRVEWTTLLFFAAMFVTMECLSRLGLIAWIGKQTETIILSVSEDSRLAMAIFIILWVSAITSAFVDSIPVTTMMVKVVVSLADNDALNLPVQPLVWALAFGPCLGGNGTLYGASANVVAAGIAEQHGYKITFTKFTKVAFPIMLGSVIIITGYLMFAHVLFQWH